MIHILIVDDEDRLRRVIKDFLKRDGYQIWEAKDGAEAISLFDQKKDLLNLVILDVMMPKVDGWGVLRHIRQGGSQIPVMMLTAKTEDDDQVFGLETGADDYVTKPISPIVLVARVKALLRRSLEKQISSRKEFGPLVVDEIGHAVYLNRAPLELSPKEYDLLVYLVSNEGIALSREQLVNVVWGYDYFGDLRTLDTHIKNLRAKLGGPGEWIKTLRGFGYKFEAAV
jgi:two-component system response regulator ResD